MKNQHMVDLLNERAYFNRKAKSALAEGDIADAIDAQRKAHGVEVQIAKAKLGAFESKVTDHTQNPGRRNGEEYVAVNPLLG